MNRLIAMSALSLVLAACGNNPEDPTTPASEGDMGEASSQTPSENAPVAMQDGVDYAQLDAVIGADWRSEEGERDVWRHPQQTIDFFDIDPSGTVIEIWPGSGWYTHILAPWVHANGGHYVAALYPFDMENERHVEFLNGFKERFSAPQYGEVTYTTLSADSGALAEAGSVDAILTFRNAHNWMGAGYAEKAFADFYTALKPGGILGVVDHRLPATREQDPTAASGYVQQDYIIALAQEAGFEFVEASEVNANPADTADHPFGVWTLPPVRRSAPRGEEQAADFDREAYDAIGESDRMTLRFVKPMNEASAE